MLQACILFFRDEKVTNDLRAAEGFDKILVFFEAWLQLNKSRFAQLQEINYSALFMDSRARLLDEWDSIDETLEELRSLAKKKTKTAVDK